MQTHPMAMRTQLELNGRLPAHQIQQLEKSMDNDNIAPRNRSLIEAAGFFQIYGAFSPVAPYIIDTLTA